MLRKSSTFILIDDEQDLNLIKIKLLGQGSYGEVILFIFHSSEGLVGKGCGLEIFCIKDPKLN